VNETANEIKRLQGCINDLIGVLALPAMWKGQDATQIVRTLLDVLVAMLRLDFAYVRLNDPIGGGPIEMVRHDQLRGSAAEAGVIGQTLNQSLGANLRKWPPRAQNPFGEGSLSIVPLGSGRDDEIGVIVAASPRADFPWQTETVVLNVAANQAAIGLASARAYEQERLRAEALAQIDRAKTQFFTSVSHEFRTPLTLMLGPLEEVLPEAGERLGPERHEQLLMVRRNALRLLKLVNALLDFSRIEAGRVQAVYQLTDLAILTSEISSVFRSAIENAGLRFSVECQPMVERVYVDRDMWEKIVLNLLSNALKFTFEGEVALTLKTVDGAVELQVRDTGVGIASEQRERVFERFHRIEGVRARTYEGTGIGLALVQELVKLHGGSVRVESALDQGSTFTVTIPSGKAHLPADRIEAVQSFAPTRIRAAAFSEESERWLGVESDAAGNAAMLGKPPPLTSAPEPTSGAKRELIVLADDNADMRQYLTHVLGDRYEVHAVADGHQALEATRQLHPALVLADVMMPRLDGFGLLRAIRDDSALADTPVILLSARAGEESRVEGLRADADDYLVKPFAARELLARLATHLKMAKQRRETAEREERLRGDAELEREKLRASEERLVETTRLFRELQNREGKIRRLVEANIVGIFIWDVEGRILEANDAFLRIVGYDRANLGSGGMRWADLTPPEWLELDLGRRVQELKATGSAQPLEKEYFRKDGSRVPVLIGSALFEENSNEGVAFVLDLTERKRAEEALRELESNLAHMNRVSMMGELAASLAHEITQPIGSARNNARTAQNYLNMQPPKPNEVQAALDRLIGNVDRAGKIIDRIREHMKKAPPRKERFDLNAAINEVIVLPRSLIIRNGVSVQTRLAGGLFPVQGDRIQLQQVVMNLILNAVEAMGLVEVGARELLVTTEQTEANELLVAVRDSGPGIKPAQLERVFEAFYTTKVNGVGMGLSICRSIVHAHGGRLWATANEPHGAAFQFTLPIAEMKP